jgi:hypothetical protein
LEVARPPDLDYAVHLSKVVSKLSPLVGNMIEYGAISYLNEKAAHPNGRWERQDPGFPDTIFRGNVTPAPGIEIKTWFPLATEITARFKDSITHFSDDQTNVAMLAWVPEFIIFGKPRILDVWIDTARSVAEARDKHYHNPPDYLVFEPEDTSARTSNLQQTNTNGYKFQGTSAQFKQAERMVASWGRKGKTFSHASEYQAKLAALLGKFKYRLDTNFAKMDRIEHTSLEEFKTRVLGSTFYGRTMVEWARILDGVESAENRSLLQTLIEDKRIKAPEVFNGGSGPSAK